MQKFLTSPSLSLSNVRPFQGFFRLLPSERKKQQKVGIKFKNALEFSCKNHKYLILYLSIVKAVLRGSIAQLGEHLPYKQGVTGSSPVVPTTY